MSVPCIFKHNDKGIASAQWNIDPTILRECEIHELIDGISVHVKQDYWLADKGGGVLYTIPLTAGARPFYEGFINWLDGWGPPNGQEQERLPEGTYELIGPGIKDNPYDSTMYVLMPHNLPYPKDLLPKAQVEDGELVYWREFAKFMLHAAIEGFVWVRDGKPYATLRRKDFGLPWPVQQPPMRSVPTNPSEPTQS